VKVETRELEKERALVLDNKKGLKKSHQKKKKRCVKFCEQEKREKNVES